MKNLEFMSMEELSRLVRNEGEDRLLREGAARELAKRENALFHKHPCARKLTSFDYGL